LNGVVAIAGGENHCLALKSDSTVVAWGGDQAGQTEVPGGLTGVSAIAAGWHYSLALVGGGVQLRIASARWSNNSFSASVLSQNGSLYTLEYKNAPSDATWTDLPVVAGNGGLLTLTDPAATARARFYRVRQQ
jgi:alpha-tubulin suppressor-like RCC1 family protein